MKKYFALAVLGALAAISLIRCDSPASPEGPAIFVQSARVSGCGGFGKGEQAPTDSSSYCDAEVLQWSYERNSATLHLSDNRVLLNCCGKHGMRVDFESGVYMFTETDDPGSAGRCFCMCVFDFAVSVQGIPEKTIPVRIERIVTDDPQSPYLVYEGELDLSIGSGSVIVDDRDVSPWCE